MSTHDQTPGKINQGYREYVVQCLICLDRAVDYFDQMQKFAHSIRQDGWRIHYGLWCCPRCLRTLRSKARKVTHD